MIDRSWTLEQALEVVRKLDPLTRRIGCFTGLTGSVLHKGRSEKDLDITVIPLDASKPIDLWGICFALKDGMGWKRTHSEADIKKIWADKGSTDIKHVEVWRTPEGRRVDIMIVK